MEFLKGVAGVGVCDGYSAYRKLDREKLDMVFVQDNQSLSVKGVLCGLHFQNQFPRGNWCATSAEPYLMWQ